MTATRDGNVLTFTGLVGPAEGADCFTVSDVLRLMAEVPEDETLTVRVNSYGGDAADGLALHSILTGRPGPVHTHVLSIAASAATAVVLAGSERTMAASATMMLHEAGVSFVGANSDDLASLSAAQGAFTSAYARLYARVTGRGDDEVRAWMKATTWFDADEAVAAGLATDVGEEVDADVPAFDYRTLPNAPDRLVAMASRNDWRDRPKPLDAQAEKARADRAEAALAQLRAKTVEADDYEASRVAAMEGARAVSAARPVARHGAQASHAGPVRWSDFTTNNGAAR